MKSTPLGGAVPRTVPVVHTEAPRAPATDTKPASTAPGLPPENTLVDKGGSSVATTGAAKSALRLGARAFEVADQQRTLGLAAYDRDEPAAVLEHLGACAAALEELPIARGFAHALNVLGEAQHGRDPTAAEASYREAIRRAQAEGDKSSESKPTLNLGYLAREANRLDDALVYMRSSSRLAKESGNPKVEAEAEFCIGNVQLDRGKLDEAMVNLARVAETATPEMWSRGAAILAMGRIHQQKGEFPLARSQFERALADDPSGTAHYAHTHLAIIALATEADASEHLKEARTACDSRDQSDPWTLHYSALTAVAAQDPDALARVQTAFEASREQMGMLLDLRRQYAALPASPLRDAALATLLLPAPLTPSWG